MNIYIEYLAIGEQVVKKRLLSIIKTLAIRNIRNIFYFMQFDITQYKWQVNKQIKQICERPSLLDENDVKDLKDEIDDIILEVEKKKQKWENLKSIVLALLAIGFSGRIFFYIFNKLKYNKK